MDGITHQKITKNHKFRVLFCYHMVSFMLEKWKSDPVVSFLNSKAAGSIIQKNIQNRPAILLQDSGCPSSKLTKKTQFSLWKVGKNMIKKLTKNLT